MRLASSSLKLLLAALLVTSLHCGRQAKPGGPLNLVLIMVDTLRPDHLGCYGYSAIRTPRIDGLASTGVRFSQAVSHVPLTLPSTASLLTGLIPPHHGVRVNQGFALPDSLVTLAETLARAGYRTGAIVGSVVLESRTGIGQGFQEFDDKLGGGYEIRSPLYVSRAKELKDTQRRAGEVTRRAVAWLERSGSQPFFLFLHYFDPHDIYDPPAPYDSIYADRPYDGEIAYTDEQIGILLDTLVRLGLQRKTLIVLTADHGEGLNEHAEAIHGFFLYDATLRIPLLVSCPGIVPRGRTVTDQVRTTDILPTVLDLMGVASPGGGDGTSLVPMMLGRGKGQARASYCETYHTRLNYGWSELVGVRTPEWKYVWGPEPELYDLKSDPQELRNLSIERVDLTSRFESMVAELRRAPKQEGEGNLSPEVRERLKTLGYIEEVPGGEPEGKIPLPNPRDMIDLYNRRQDAKKAVQKMVFWAKEGKADSAKGELLRALASNREEMAERLKDLRQNLRDAEVGSTLQRQLLGVTKDILRSDPT